MNAFNSKTLEGNWFEERAHPRQFYEPPTQQDVVFGRKVKRFPQPKSDAVLPTVDGVSEFSTTSNSSFANRNVERDPDVGKYCKKSYIKEFYEDRSEEKKGHHQKSFIPGLSDGVRTEDDFVGEFKACFVSIDSKEVEKVQSAGVTHTYKRETVIPGVLDDGQECRSLNMLNPEGSWKGNLRKHPITKASLSNKVQVFDDY